MNDRPAIFTNNEWSMGSAELFSSFDSSDGTAIWQGKSASALDVDSVVMNAKHAFQNWSSMLLENRIHYLLNAKEQLNRKREIIALAISKETGKPLWDSQNEVDAMLGKFHLSQKAYEERCKHIHTAHPQGQSITRHQPHGVMAILGPFNFPGHLPNGHLVPALLAGNTVVLKPSELTPLASEEIMNCWHEAKLPPGVINMVQGSSSTGSALAYHPLINGLLFTGSAQTGLHLSKHLSAFPDKIVALEMGGNNPLIVSHTSDLEAAAYLIIQSAFLTSGQRCTCARRLIIKETDNSLKLIEILIQMIKKLNIGCYNQKPEPFMGPVIHSKQADFLLSLQSDYICQGAKSLHQMKRLDPQKCPALLCPALIDVTNMESIPDIEIFGPFLQVIRVADFESAVAAANQTQFGLAAGLLSSSNDEYNYFRQHIQAGVVNWNAPLTGASSAAPFGGIKSSGNFRPSAYYAADYCSYPVASIESQLLHMPPTILPGINLLTSRKNTK